MKSASVGLSTNRSSSYERVAKGRLLPSLALVLRLGPLLLPPLLLLAEAPLLARLLMLGVLVALVLLVVVRALLP